MDRKLREVIRADGSHDIVEVSPGPYSFSAPKETVLFSMTAGEVAGLAAASDKTTEKPA